jgi:predicted Ser/Thr protein kinase
MMSHIEASRSADPRQVADVVLSSALHAAADAVFIEPVAGEPDMYAMVFEREATMLTTVVVDASLGEAVVARLAYLADLDLAATTTTTGVLNVCAGSCDGDVVVTLRPGTSVRADLMVRPRVRGSATNLVRPEPRELVPGDIVGHYVVRDVLGAGGMGVVYRVEHVSLGREHALKLLSAPVLDYDPSHVERFLREARAAARIRHPNIAEVFDYGQHVDGRPYLVMELVQGERLTDLIARGPLPPKDVVTIARQLAGALAEAHDRGVIHADITPANVLVVAGDALRVKLIDFGLAELAGERLGYTDPGFVLGTPEYISPEQLRGSSASDRSDQYGLGVVLYELLVGRPPFEDEDLHALLRKHLSAPVPPIESPHGPLPPRLADVVTTCLQKTPQARFPGMRALLAALADVERVTVRRGWRRWLAS